jgi:transcriptional regulator with XRE-family HTH domain
MAYKEENMKIGKKLRELRKEKGLTLEELSRKSGIALATLSRMENEKMAGTVEAQNRICDALGTSLATLYGELEALTKTVENIATDGRIEHLPVSAGARAELLVSKTRGKNMFPVMLSLLPGGETAMEQCGPGTEKFVYAMSGNFDAEIGGRTYGMKRGDSLYFDASLPHVFRNKSEAKSEVMCVASPARD